MNISPKSSEIIDNVCCNFNNSIVIHIGKVRKEPGKSIFQLLVGEAQKASPLSTAKDDSSLIERR